jgi:hypothetical protein
MPKQKFSSKRERFLKVAEARTNAVLEKIRVLGNCANRSLYEYKEEEVNKIFRVIQESLNETKLKFKNKKESFKFKI